MDRRQDAGDARWLSYDEIAALRGIDRASAIRMVRRKHWAKQDANDGTTRVAVPGQFFRAKRTKADASGQNVTWQSAPVLWQSSVNDNDNHPVLSALSGHVATLREQLTLAQGAAAGREEQLKAARDETAAERTRAAVAEAKLEAAEAALARERERADRAEAEARRPWWRKLIG